MKSCPTSPQVNPAWKYFRKVYSRDLTGDLLHWSKQHLVPFDMHKLSRQLGVLVVEEEMTEAAKLSVAGNAAVISVKKGVSFARQRFAIAHELGHLILHYNGRNFVDSNFKTETQQELEANKFAVRLLMPAYFLNTAGLHWITQNIAQVARELNVTEELLNLRISGLLRLDDRWL